MILVKCYGGLGNQMFQYAVGRHLAIIHGTELKYDDGFFEFKNDPSSTRRKFELQVFHTQIEKATEKEIRSFLKKGKIIGRLEKRFPVLRRKVVLNEKFHPFDPEVLLAGKHTYLNGYWQSEKYFIGIREVLLKDFRLRLPLEGQNKVLAEKCRQTHSLAIHIRRGDYVSNPKNTAYHGVCSLEYYYSGLALIRNKLPQESKLFVFSDDAAWVRENFFPGTDYTLVDNNPGDKAYFDLHLMSLCHHHIIANSSFSWWAAWLNAKEDKLVVAPKQWFSTSEIDSSQVVPESWIRV